MTYFEQFHKLRAEALERQRIDSIRYEFVKVLRKAVSERFVNATLAVKRTGFDDFDTPADCDIFGVGLTLAAPHLYIVDSVTDARLRVHLPALLKELGIEAPGADRPAK